MRIKTFSSKKSNFSEALLESKNSISEASNLIMLYANSDHDWSKLSQSVSSHFPESKIIGASSSRGFLSNDGNFFDENYGIGVFAIEDYSGEIGVGFSSSADPQMVAKEVCDRMLDNAQREGEVPDFLWIITSPGQEEEILANINKYFGSHVNICGGSCADNEIAGNWKMFNGQDVFSQGCIVVGFFAQDEKILSSFQSGYYPTSKSAVVTAANGRELFALNGESAAKVYNEWMDGRFSDLDLSENPSITTETTYFPFGREKGKVHDIPYYLLSHPESLTAEGGIRLFTDVHVGDKLILMESSQYDLQRRLADVVKKQMIRAQISTEDIAGILVVYCAGCMLALQGTDKIDGIAEELKKIIGEIPFMAIHTFGEQGRFFEDGESHHGNLMVSANIFLK